MRLEGKRVLMIAAHPDDEFGCAGTIRRMILGGSRVSYLALSGCQESIPNLSPETRAEEARECMCRLGVMSRRFEVADFPLRNFPESRQAILEFMLRKREEVRPDIVLLPCSGDMHQDHVVVAEEGFRAFKHSTILGYLLPQNLNQITNSFFVHLSREQLDKKVFAMSAHESQANRSYASEEFIRAFARTCGLQAGTEFAEAFEPVRVMWKL